MNGLVAPGMLVNVPGTTGADCKMNPAVLQPKESG